MQHYLFSNILGSFVFNESGELLERGDEKTLKKKYSKLNEPDLEMKKNILAYFKQQRFFPSFYKENLDLTKQSLRESVGKDWLMIQTINAIRELDKIINTLVKRLRELYELYNPELSRAIEDNEKFVRAIANKKDKKPKDSIGAELTESDLGSMRQLASSLNDLCKLRQNQENYLEQLMSSKCPNLQAVAGSLIGAKLLERAGSLKHLAELPASTIQVLGAEKALFRHMRTGSKPPKYGVLYQHQLVQTSKKNQQGKAARMLADKISIAVKVDYFKGEFVGDKLMADIKRRLGK